MNMQYVHIMFIVFVAFVVFIIPGILFSGLSDSNVVCVLDEKGNCKIDITEEFRNRGVDSGRECGKNDRYYEIQRYICVKNITLTEDPYHIERGANTKAETYFTAIDGNSYIYNSNDIILKENHLYSTISLIQVGYCHGPNKIIEVKEICDSCNECSDSPNGIPMGYCPNVRVGVNVTEAK